MAIRKYKLIKRYERKAAKKAGTLRYLVDGKLLEKVPSVHSTEANTGRREPIRMVRLIA